MFSKPAQDRGFVEWKCGSSGKEHRCWERIPGMLILRKTCPNYLESKTTSRRECSGINRGLISKSQSQINNSALPSWKRNRPPGRFTPHGLLASSQVQGLGVSVLSVQGGTPSMWSARQQNAFVSTRDYMHNLEMYFGKSRQLRLICIFHGFPAALPSIVRTGTTCRRWLQALLKGKVGMRHIPDWGRSRRKGR